jgi:hypothetical protein
MAEQNTVTIGGEDVVLPPIMNFATLERAWPALQAMAAAQDPIASAASAIALVAAALVSTRPDLTMPVIKERLRINVVDGTDERPGLLRAVDRLCVASGLVRAGEARPPEPPAADAAVST